MGEYFELTFFSVKDKVIRDEEKRIRSILMLDGWVNTIKQHSFSAFENREVLFDVFDEFDFYEYRICISNFIITKASFDEKLGHLLEIVKVCFDRIDSIVFATGIYELTYYYIENVRKLSEFNTAIMEKFPFVFMKENNTFNLSNVQKQKNIFYAVHTGESVQNIFSEEQENNTGDGSVC